MIIFLISFCASTQAIRATEMPKVRVLIDSLSRGFTFKWYMENKFMKMRGEGTYKGKNNIDIKGWIETPEGRLSVKDYDPYEQIKIVCGEKRFVFKKRVGSTYIFEFPAVLFFLNPVKGMGKGLLYVREGRIVKISAETEGALWEMEIGKFKRPLTKIELMCEHCHPEKIAERMKLWGEKEINVNNKVISFFMVIPLHPGIFRKGDVKWIKLKQVEGGVIKDPLDTTFTYNLGGVYPLEIEDVALGTDPRGRPSVILNIRNPLDGIIGLFAHDTLKSTGFGNNPMFLPFRDSIEAKLVYIYLKTGPLFEDFVKIRRLK